MCEIDHAISRLVGYGLAAGLIQDEDLNYSINSILKELKKKTLREVLPRRSPMPLPLEKKGWLMEKSWRRI